MFGREERLPIDLTRVKHTNEQDEALSFDDKVTKMLEMQMTLHDQARDNIHEAQERQKRQYVPKHNSRTDLKVGDKVLVQEMRNKGRKQFPEVQGCQSTLLQQNKGFTAVSGEGMYV